MGFLDKARAIRLDTEAKAKKKAESVEGRLEGEAYTAAKVRATGALHGAGRAAKAGGVGLTGLAERSQHARKVGEVVRRVTREAQGLPVLSVAGDIANRKHGLEDLARMVRERPDDPVRNQWLAEAIRRTEADLKAYSLVRTAINPYSLVVSNSVRAAAAVGSERSYGGRASDALLRRARALAAGRLEETPLDADALDVLARADLLAGQPDLALRAARLAVAADPNHPAIRLVTLARVYMALEHKASAARAAALSVAHGSSVGYEVLADLALLDESGDPLPARVRRYERLRNQVNRGDRLAYYGADQTGGEVARALLFSQAAKTWGTAKRVGGAAKAVIRRRRPASDDHVGTREDGQPAPPSETNTRR